MKKVAIHNLGCKVNSYEEESMEQMLRAAGYSIVPFDENVPADVYIINTCSVTNIADRKSRQMLHKAKKMNPDAIVVAAGCYVQSDSEGQSFSIQHTEYLACICHLHSRCTSIRVTRNYILSQTLGSNGKFLSEFPGTQQKYFRYPVSFHCG